MKKLERDMIARMAKASLRASRMRNGFVMLTIVLASALLMGILMFAVGAVMGSVTTSLLGERTIWLSCVLLLASFIIMFVREDIEKKEGF